VNSSRLRNPRVVVRPGESLNTFYRGRIKILQNKAGYRFALDAPLLADFIKTKPGDELLELGTGSGIIALLLSLKPFARLTALEIQPSLAGLARRNIRLNGLEKRITVVRADLRKYRPGTRFDVVFSNPPYIRKETGFLSAVAEKSVAKHELKCDILGVMRATSELLKPAGRAYFVFPAGRTEDFAQTADSAGLVLRRRRFVMPREGAAPTLFLAECRFERGRLRERPPLVLRDAAGADTAEARSVFEGRRRGPGH
jgi:tRNA1Val (adenine37-N6)-methyltransferase